MPFLSFEAFMTSDWTPYLLGATLLAVLLAYLWYRSVVNVYNCTRPTCAITDAIRALLLPSSCKGSYVLFTANCTLSAVAALSTIPTSISSSLASRGPPRFPSSATCTRRMYVGYSCSECYTACTLTLCVMCCRYVSGCMCTSILLQKYLKNINAQLCQEYGDLCG